MNCNTNKLSEFVLRLEVRTQIFAHPTKASNVVSSLGIMIAKTCNWFS